MTSTELLHQYIKNENLRKHCYAVWCIHEDFYAKQQGEDENKWGDAGLLHNLGLGNVYPILVRTQQYQSLKRTATIKNLWMQF